MKLCFLKIMFSFALFFDEDNIVKLGIDHAVCEEIAATDGCNRNQAFSIFEHALSRVLNVINIMNFSDMPINRWQIF